VVPRRLDLQDRWPERERFGFDLHREPGGCLAATPGQVTQDEVLFGDIGRTALPGRQAAGFGDSRLGRLQVVDGERRDCQVVVQRHRIHIGTVRHALTQQIVGLLVPAGPMGRQWVRGRILRQQHQGRRQQERLHRRDLATEIDHDNNNRATNSGRR
jgi:hypothetical protein